MKAPILFIDTRRAFGGDTRVLLDMVAALQDSPFQPIVAAAEGGAAHAALDNMQAVEVVPLRIEERADCSAGAYWQGIIRAAAQLASLCRRRGIRVVHLNTNLAGTAQLLALQLRAVSLGQVRMIYHAHCAPKHNHMTRLACRFASQVWAVSRFTARQYVEAGFAGQGKVRVLPNTTGFSGFPSAPTDHWRAHLGIPAGARVLGIVGRLSPNKGQEIAIRALHQLRDHQELHLILAGSDAVVEGIPNYGGHLRGLARQLDLEDRIHFTGHLDDVSPVYHALDLALVPSEEEAFCLSALEAIAAGVPVIASNRAGLREVVAQTAGLPVYERTPQDFADAIVGHLYGNATISQEAARQRCRDAYGPKSFQRNLQTLLHQITPSAHTPKSDQHGEKKECPILPLSLTTSASW